MAVAADAATAGAIKHTRLDYRHPPLWGKADLASSVYARSPWLGQDYL